MNDAHEILTRARIDGIRKLREAGVELPAAAFMVFEDTQCDKNPMLALQRISAMGLESRRDLGRAAKTDLRVQHKIGNSNRYEPNVIDATGIEVDQDRERYLASKYGLCHHTSGTELGTMKLDADGNEIVGAS